jgi:putative FmdB family regulatory protein
MPIYEYQCQACKHQLEAMQKISEAALLDCSNCGQSQLKKMVSAAAFRLKGGGWYETDFKTGDKKNLANEKSESNSSSSDSSSSSGNSSSDSSDSAAAG